MRFIYSFLLYLITPFILLRLYWKGRRMPAYRQRINERFALEIPEHGPIDIWLHGVSLGEVVAATPLIDLLLAAGWRVLVTTMTPTGSQHVSKRFGDKVAHQYLPYDLPLVLRRFFKKVKPRLLVTMETELWPNLIHYAYQQQIPILLVNARLSDGAFKQYEKMQFMFKPVLQQFTAILAQSQEDAKRFLALGAPEEKVRVLGNIKFDLQVKNTEKPECTQLKEQWGTHRSVVIAASTHDNEEKQWLSRLPQLQKAIPNVLLIIAPRHPERFQPVFQMSIDNGFKTGLRSQPTTIGTDTEVVIADSLGELLVFYKLSDYAFVGGSLVPIGGHNVLEPIAVEVPVFCGPYMNNSKSICKDLCEAKAMVLGSDLDDIIQHIVKMEQHPEQRQEQVRKASTVMEANRGTITRYYKEIEFKLRRNKD